MASKEGVFNWKSPEYGGQATAVKVRVRAEIEGLPALLIVQVLTDGLGPLAVLGRLRMSHWRRAPLGRVLTMEPKEVNGLVFERSIFETRHPRRSTVLAACARRLDGEVLASQMLVAGFGRIDDRLHEVLDESIKKAIELASEF